jgi:hypothetical protein
LNRPYKYEKHKGQLVKAGLMQGVVIGINFIYLPLSVNDYFKKKGISFGYWIPMHYCAHYPGGRLLHLSLTNCMKENMSYGAVEDH